MCQDIEQDFFAICSKEFIYDAGVESYEPVEMFGLLSYGLCMGYTTNKDEHNINIDTTQRRLEPTNCRASYIKRERRSIWP